jgi:type IV secretory pathway VirB3-like protein
MLDPFPEEVEVPYGLVNFRAIYGIPVGICMTLALLGIGPLFLWGRRKWWVSVICVAVGMLVALMAKEDPQCFSAWGGEYGLKDYYD